MIDKTLIDNFNYIVLISVRGINSLGTGFLFNYKGSVYLMTAKHVLFKDNELFGEEILLTSQTPRGEYSRANIIEIYNLSTKVYKSLTDDVAIVRLGTNNAIEENDDVRIVQRGPEISIVNETNIKLIDEITLANDAFLIGFPTSLEEIEITKPLLRKGIIAGINIDNFIVDCPSYYGNSGGPILEICDDESLKIIGIVIKYIPFIIEWRNNRESSVVHNEFSNSGYSICLPMDKFYNLLNSI
jgi:hypothetical protein